MKLKIYQRKGDKSNLEIFEKATRFFADQLMPKSKQSALEIKVVIKNFYGKEYSKNYGYCSRNGNTHQYLIEINRFKPFHAIICTLAHEMVHVKQAESGIYEMTTFGYIWKNKQYKYVDLLDTKIYNSTPWELEAHKLELELTIKFFKEVMTQEVKII